MLRFELECTVTVGHVVEYLEKKWGHILQAGSLRLYSTGLGEHAGWGRGSSVTVSTIFAKSRWPAAGGRLMYYWVPEARRPVNVTNNSRAAELEGMVTVWKRTEEAPKQDRVPFCMRGKKVIVAQPSPVVDRVGLENEEIARILVGMGLSTFEETVAEKLCELKGMSGSWKRMSEGDLGGNSKRARGTLHENKENIVPNLNGGVVEPEEVDMELVWHERIRSNKTIKTAIIPHTRVRIVYSPSGLDSASYEQFLQDIRIAPWEQNYSSFMNGLRKPLSHLQLCFSFDDSLEAYAANYGEVSSGQRWCQFFQPFTTSSWPSTSFNDVRGGIGSLGGAYNSVQMLLYRPTESSVAKKAEAIGRHVDGSQLCDKSSICTFVAGHSGAMVYSVKGRRYSFRTEGNSFYKIEYIEESDLSPAEKEQVKSWWNSSEDLPQPRSVVHWRNNSRFPEDGFQLVAVFRNLQPWKDNVGLLRKRWELEKLTPVSIDWRNLAKSCWKFERITGVVAKPTDPLRRYVLEKVNSLEKIVLVSNHEGFFGHGDEFDSDPLATALLGIHYLFSNGRAYAGNALDGIVSIRCGPQDEIINDSAVVFKVPKTTKQLPAFLVSYRNGVMVRVLLSASKWYSARRYPNSQYYLNNMYIHKVTDQETHWAFTLRVSPRPTDAPHFGQCSCC